MNIHCGRIRAAAADGRSLDETQRRHVDGCPACAAVVRELRRVDEDLAALKREVPGHLIETTLQRVAEDAQGGERTLPPRAPRLFGRFGDRRVAAGVAVGLAVVVLSALSVGRHGFVSPRLYGRGPVATVSRAPEQRAPERKHEGRWGGSKAISASVDGEDEVFEEVARSRDDIGAQSFYNELPADALDVDRTEVAGKKTEVGGSVEWATGPPARPLTGFGDEASSTEVAGPEPQRVARAVPPGEPSGVRHQPRHGAVPGASSPYASRVDEEARRRESKPLLRGDMVERKLFAADPAPAVPPVSVRQPPSPPTDRAWPSEPSVSGESVQVANGRSAQLQAKEDGFYRSPGLSNLETDEEPLREAGEAVETERETEDLAVDGSNRARVKIDGMARGDRLGGVAEEGEVGRAAVSPLEDVLRRFGYGVLGCRPEEWRHVTLDRPVYFENTYLGGNAKLALLDHLAGTFELGTEMVAPHRLARLLPQNLDPPVQGGMALHVDLDHATVAHGEQTRVFLQVGLRGGDNPAWRRPPLSVAVLSLVSRAEARERARAAAEELRMGLERQDAFGWVQPGRPLAFTSARDAHLPDHFSTAPPDLEEQDLARLLQDVGKAFVTGEAPGGLRNRRLVILTDRELGGHVRNAAHRLGLQEVATSVISLDRSHFASHARIAMAGLGNLHVARSVGEARQVARDELASFTRVVARALRLNIQPAPGVKLIQVLGSRPLDLAEKKRVKAGERAIDRHAERTTGIARDRGGDDPGLQTVIPYFYGSDEHVVIVELEVDGPGPVAEVSLKYKDLVDTRNQILRASAALPRRPAAETARREHVRRNLLGFAVARVLHRLEQSVRSGGSGAQDLDDLKALIGAARASMGGSETAVGIADDIRMLEQYLQLASGGPRTGDLASSLGYARLAKLGRSR